MLPPALPYTQETLPLQCQRSPQGWHFHWSTLPGHQTTSVLMYKGVNSAMHDNPSRRAAFVIKKISLLYIDGPFVEQQWSRRKDINIKIVFFLKLNYHLFSVCLSNSSFISANSTECDSWKVLVTSWPMLAFLAAISQISFATSSCFYGWPNLVGFPFILALWLASSFLSLGGWSYCNATSCTLH